MKYQGAKTYVIARLPNKIARRLKQGGNSKDRRIRRRALLRFAENNSHAYQATVTSWSKDEPL